MHPFLIIVISVRIVCALPGFLESTELEGSFKKLLEIPKFELVAFENKANAEISDTLSHQATEKMDAFPNTLQEADSGLAEAIWKVQTIQSLVHDLISRV